MSPLKPDSSLAPPVEAIKMRREAARWRPRLGIGRRVMSVRERRLKRFGWFLVLPACLLILFLNVFPIFFTLGASLVRWNLARARIPPRFVGLDNFESLLREPLLLQAATNTLIFIVGTVAIQTVLGIAIALLLNQQLKGTRLALAVMMVPMTISPAVVSWLFSVLLSETLGPVAYALSVFGLPSPPWLSDPRLALATIIMVDAWQWTPFMVIMILAALRSQPASFIEAALLDGANSWQRFYYVVLPLLRPVLVVAMLLRVVDAFKMFDLVYLMTGGGPGTATQTLGFYAYRVGLTYFDVGKASTISTVMLVVAMVFTVAFYRLAGRRR